MPDTVQKEYDAETIRKYEAEYVLTPWTTQKGLNPFVAAKAKGCWVYNQEGRKYLDLTSQFVFTNLGHSNLILTAGGGSYGHLDGAAAGAISLRQAEQCWRAGADPLQFAQDHPEFARAFESFPADADRLYPAWRRTLDVAA